MRIVSFAMLLWPLLLYSADPIARGPTSLTKQKADGWHVEVNVVTAPRLQWPAPVVYKVYAPPPPPPPRMIVVRKRRARPVHREFVYDYRPDERERILEMGTTDRRGRRHGGVAVVVNGRYKRFEKWEHGRRIK